MLSREYVVLPANLLKRILANKELICWQSTEG